MRFNSLYYRGYSIHDLAQHSTFEETAYLLLHGELPRREQLGVFDKELRAEREIPGAIVDIIRSTQDAHPMDVARTAVSALSTFDPEVAAAARSRTRSASSTALASASSGVRTALT